MGKMSRRALLGTSGGALAAGVIAAKGPAPSLPHATSRRRGAVKSHGVQLRRLGTAAWEIRAGARTILLDPWLTRSGDGERTDPSTPLSVDPAIIDRHIERADLIAAASPHARFVVVDHLKTFSA
jgi:hypothetical protein